MEATVYTWETEEVINWMINEESYYLESEEIKEMETLEAQEKATRQLVLIIYENHRTSEWDLNEVDFEDILNYINEED